MSNTVPTDEREGAGEERRRRDLGRGAAQGGNVMSWRDVVSALCCAVQCSAVPSHVVLLPVRTPHRSRCTCWWGAATSCTTVGFPVGGPPERATTQQASPAVGDGLQPRTPAPASCFLAVVAQCIWFATRTCSTAAKQSALCRTLSPSGQP